jgi:hypothetical protein
MFWRQFNIFNTIKKAVGIVARAFALCASSSYPLLARFEIIDHSAPPFLPSRGLAHDLLS